MITYWVGGAAFWVHMAWAGEVLRIVFWPATAGQDAPELFQLIAGQSADNTQKKGLALPVLSLAAGEWRGFALTVAVQVGRFEAALTMVDPEPTAPTLVPHIPRELLSEAIDAMRILTEKLSDIGPANRLAAHMQLVEALDTVEAGTAFLNAELGNIFPAEADHIQYQLNVRRAVDDLSINRIAKWGVITVSTMQVALDAGGSNVLAPVKGEERHLTFLHLDINNVPQESPMAPAAEKALGKVLWDEADKIMKGGKRALS